MIDIAENIHVWSPYILFTLLLSMMLIQWRVVHSLIKQCKSEREQVTEMAGAGEELADLCEKMAQELLKTQETMNRNADNANKHVEMTNKHSQELYELKLQMIDSANGK